MLGKGEMTEGGHAATSSLDMKACFAMNINERAASTTASGQLWIVK